MGYVNVGKENSEPIDLYYEDHGSGAPVVLIHGFPLSGRSWEKQRAALLEGGHRVITYDRRGFGQSSQPTTGYDYDTFASDLDKLLSHLNLRDVTLAGFSMGGGEVARYMGKHGSGGLSRISKVAILSGVPPYLLKSADHPEGGLDQAGIKGLQDSIRQDRFAFLRSFFDNFYNVDTFLGKRISKDDLHDSWNVGAGASPEGTYLCPPTWVEDFRPDLAKIDKPTLVMQGTADRILPIGSTGMLTRQMVKGSQYVQIEGAPHGMLWTHADEVNKTLLDFIAGRPVGSQMQQPTATS